MTAGALVAWLAVIVAIWAIRFPRRPRPGPETTDLGVESPAVVNLLAHRFKPTRDAVPATLVDLAARGLVEIEDRGIGRYFCRLTGRQASVEPYEDMLLDHLRSVSAGGVVPAEALTTGPQDRSRAWWKEFEKKVVAHAQAQELSRDLWDKWAQGALFVGAAIVFLLYGMATGFNDPDHVAPSTLKDVVQVAGIVAFLVVFRAASSKRQRSTDEGDRAAARWLGVRRALEESPSFELLPPSGVAVWERHLAYACALGAAPHSARALPMGAESDSEVWLVREGEWQKVTVGYPRLRPGWGRHPLHALAVGGLGTYAGYNVLRVAAGGIGFDNRWLAIGGTLAFALGTTLLARSLPQLVWGILDLFGSRTVEGPVLRARTRWGPIPYFTQGEDQQYLRYFVAIDDGRSAALTAYRVKPALYQALAQGTTAKLEVTQNLGYVRRPSA